MQGFFHKCVTTPLNVYTASPVCAAADRGQLARAKKSGRRPDFTSFDEVSALARKVKEAQIAQKQKERDFIQARRAIERIRMAI